MLNPSFLLYGKFLSVFLQASYTLFLGREYFQDESDLPCLQSLGWLPTALKIHTQDLTLHSWKANYDPILLYLLSFCAPLYIISLIPF
jgi:hypothetical protein